MKWGATPWFRNGRKDYRDGYITTIEGNANAHHSLEGTGVVALERKLETINVGFIKYD
jgi:hypothetical protein